MGTNLRFSEKVSLTVRAGDLVKRGSGVEEIEGERETLPVAREGEEGRDDPRHA